ncbi:MAG: hypothetical protein N2112_15850 [Gemmataceae bacterium]|jgi:hypothetical protein|nr:hypothetical protein [Gemmataceae bacterium]
MTKNSLTFQQLEKLASADLDDYSVQNLAEHLQGLAGWWLNESALQHLRELEDPSLLRLIQNGHPKLSNQLGSCWLNLVVKGQYPLLNPAVVLPLQWKKGISDSIRLPTALRQLATKIRQQITASKEIPNYQLAKEYGLDWASASFPDLADDLFTTFDSGWGSLMVGLITTLQGLKPQITVWGSLAWLDDQGVSRVEGLSEKMQVAKKWGAQKFAVALSQYQEAKKFAEISDLELIRCASAVPLRIFPAVQPYLTEYSQRPEPAQQGDEESFQRCRNYFFNLPAFSDQLDSFRDSHLKTEIVRRCRQQLQTNYPHQKWTHLISLVSHSPSLQELIVKVLQPEKCLFFYSPDPKQTKILDNVEKLKAICPQAEFVPFENQIEDMKKTFRASIQKFVSGIDASKVVIEIKSGTASMKYWLGQMAQPRNWIFNLESRMLENRENDPGTEKVELWQVE